MKTNQSMFVRRILEDRGFDPAEGLVSAYAPSNIALCKYWGKRDSELNLPLTSSLSISLGRSGTTTVMSVIDSPEDEVFYEGKQLAKESPFAQRLSTFLDLFRGPNAHHFHIDTHNDVPVAAGLASSASGFAALVEALNLLFSWKLDDRSLSLLARLGSGSACRSLWHGFVEWSAGVKADGSDSYATVMPDTWTDFCVGLVITNRDRKPISSREAMNLTRDTSSFYNEWPMVVEKDLAAIKQAISKQDFEQLGEVAESNAMTMHALMMSARPPIMYSLPETIAHIRKVWELRQSGVPVYFTQDAGANLKLLFEKKSLLAVQDNFESVEVIEPFSEFITHG